MNINKITCQASDNQPKKNNTVKYIIIGVLGCLGLSALLIFMVIIIGIVASIAIPAFISKSTKPQQVIIRTDESTARSILQSLQSSAAIYVAQQRDVPEKFSDFLILDGATSGSQVMTLSHIRSQFSKPDSEYDLDSNVFEMDFYSGLKATYYLKGTDVTADIR
ncbi:MAG: hypothetical protein AB1782_16265 [Cyanobacteriota bacterium]